MIQTDTHKVHRWPAYGFPVRYRVLRKGFKKTWTPERVAGKVAFYGTLKDACEAHDIPLDVKDVDDSAPYVKGDRESQEAARLVAGKVRPQSRALMRVIANAKDGLTRYEARLLAPVHLFDKPIGDSAACARLRAMEKAGWIARDGSARKVETGSKQKIYTATPAGIAFLEGA